MRKPFALRAPDPGGYGYGGAPGGNPGPGFPVGGYPGGALPPGAGMNPGCADARRSHGPRCNDAADAYRPVRNGRWKPERPHVSRAKTRDDARSTAARGAGQRSDHHDGRARSNSGIRSDGSLQGVSGSFGRRHAGSTTGDDARGALHATEKSRRRQAVVHRRDESHSGRRAKGFGKPDHRTIQHVSTQGPDGADQKQDAGRVWTPSCTSMAPRWPAAAAPSSSSRWATCG